MDRILEVLREVKPGFEFEGRTDLASSGDLDSFDVISIVSELNDVFDIDIPIEEIIPENFDSLEAIKELVDSLE